MTRHALRAALLLAAAATALPAQDTTVIPLPRIEVTVTRVAEPLARVPAAVSVVTRAELQRGQPGIGMEEALAFVPGVTVNNRYNFALGTRISIRGYGARAAFGVRGIRVLADGIPLTAADGQANLNNIDLASAGRIEILRGAASMLYGNAAGGVVAYGSEVPPPGLGATAQLVGGSHGLLRMNAKLGGGSARTRYLASVTRLDVDGFRDHSAAEQTGINARVRHELNDRAYVATTLNAADLPMAFNPGSLPIDSARLRPRMAWPRNAATRSGEAVRQVQGGIEYGHALGPVTAQMIIYGVTRELENPLPFAYITLDRVAGGVRSTLGGTVGAVTLTGGVDVELQKDERAEFDNVNGRAGTNQARDQTDRIVGFGPFVRGSIALTDALSASAGVRYDRTRFRIEDRFLADERNDSGTRTMSALSPMAGITLRLSEAVHTFANVSTAFQTPTTTELINNPAGTGLNALEPQRSTSYEIGLRAHSGRLAGMISAYQTRVRDALVPFQVAGGDGREFFRNAGRTRQRGVEAGAQVRITRDVRVTASHTWNDFVFVDDGLPQADWEGNRLPGVPDHHFAGKVGWLRGGAFAELELEYTGSYFATDSNAEASRNPAATVLDARAGGVVRLGRSRLAPWVGVNNLLNEKYFSSVVLNAAGARYFEPAPTRNIYLGLGVSMGNWP